MPDEGEETVLSLPNPNEIVWKAHPVLSAISNNDPEIDEILRGISKPVLTTPEMIRLGPFGTTTYYDHIKPFEKGEKADRTGLLKTWISQGRRYAFALDYARYLLTLKRIGERAALSQNSAPRSVAEHRLRSAQQVQQLQADS